MKKILSVIALIALSTPAYSVIVTEQSGTVTTAPAGIRQVAPQITPGANQASVPPPKALVKRIEISA